ncbi:Na/Pi cotransporter family protein [Chlorobium ferrooxidans]|uniref:Na+/Pi-cotransporter n=1 Tax=Chlorobium ferrooxidans DSM 13031 TaxID=377431 RepID=Q0YRC7_9CHLB|nr:Na/Pi cotransporter family protein [Chlorobium ferrooxidans]EAT58869.1 Na+/Pi-cotransporter [Chlorobium ferrooxidans DSM 13031]
MDGTYSLFSVVSLFVGGLALFLYGIRIMSTGLKKASGERVRILISNVTGNRVYGVLVGAFTSMIAQSSSVIIATLIGLVHSQLMTSTQALAVIFGAEIGTTAMAQLFAFQLHDYSLTIFAAGFALNRLGKSESLRFTGEALSGFGLLFFGLKLMTEAVAPLHNYAPFLSALRYLENPLLAVMAGVIITALIQSSGAFIGIVITLAQEGSLTLNAGIPLLLGANIGTCITAIVAGSGMLRAAKRVALAQVLFNAAGVILFLFFIPEYADFIRSISPSKDSLASDMVALEVPRQIANAHSLYNIFMALLLLPFLSGFDKLLNWLLPDDPEEIRQRPSIWYLKESALATPTLAIRYARAEIARMASIAAKMVGASCFHFIRSGPDRDVVFPKLSVLGGMVMREEKLDFLEKRVSEYLIKIARRELNERDSKEVFALMGIVKDIESIGDVIETLSGKLVGGKMWLKSELTEEGKHELTELLKHVTNDMEQLADSLSEMDSRYPSRLIMHDEEFKQLVAHAESAHMNRVARVNESEITHDIHMELINVLEQVHHYCKRIARSITACNESER